MKMVALAGALILFSCSSVDEPSETDSGEPLVSRGIITASFHRYLDGSGREPAEQFRITGLFVRHAAEAHETAASLLGMQGLDVDLPLDACSAPAPVLDDRRWSPPRRSIVELLDIGDMSVNFGSGNKTVATRTFPDLLRVIVGVIYSTDESHGVVFRPGRTYDLRTLGSDEIGPFEVALDAPEDLVDLRIAGTLPFEDTPVISRGSGLEIDWDADGFGDEVLATLGFTSLGAPWSMTCRMRDDGEFTVPASLTAALPDPLTCSDAELSLSRVRQVAFRAAGLSSGALRFEVTSDFNVTF
ncbi:MAG: hypothetical protein MUC50_03020 [Myxococcota bacterium]|nr:hypothetical protein [Myxococcota bacterium]